jgi:hypothetical protein
MSASPVTATSIRHRAGDVFERLAGCDRLLTAKELGQILAISPKTLYSYVSRGMIPFFKIESKVPTCRDRSGNRAAQADEHGSVDLSGTEVQQIIDPILQHSLLNTD